MKREVFFCHCDQLDSEIKKRPKPSTWDVVGVDFPSERIAVLLTWIALDEKGDPV